jgi:EAL domain-containing protein (putative c-di-GMP-specific phosphodiesterase class I)
MFHAKKDRRGRIVTYSKDMEGANLARLQLETDLRRAVEREQLRVFYQPQVDSETGAVAGAEALVRWHHPELGTVPPNQWIPLAEELGLIDDIGRWVMHRACSDLVALRQDGLELPRVSVNVSAMQLREAFPAEVEAVLAETGLPAEALQVELTESIMIDRRDSALRIVEALRELGVHTSVDDFGTGYSSLAYLTRLPLNELKIDRSFVVGLGRGERNAELVRGIIAMARSLHLELVVEGVESPEELAFFRREGAAVIQGYLFSAPVPLEKFRPLLAPGFYSRQLERLQRKLVMEGGLKLEQA